MIKTYLVPTTEEMIKIMENGEAPSFLHCATCLDGLTNGEVFTSTYPNIEVLGDSESKVGVNLGNGVFINFPRTWWNRKWGK